MRRGSYKALGVNPLERLRRLRGQSESAPTDRLRTAAKNIFKSSDGQLLLDYLILHSYGATAPANAPDSALREIETRKKFLDQILALTEDSSALPTQQPTPPSPSLPGT